MAGPSAAVLLPTAWAAADVDELRVWLARSFSPDGSENWWVLRDPRALGMSESLKPGPMLVEPGPHEDDDVDETACLTRAAHFAPGCEIVLAAAVNGADDHRLLAELAVLIARRYKGLIDLGGRLPVPAPVGMPPPAASDAADEHRTGGARETIMALPGRWHEIPYRTAGGEVATYHVVDADFLAAWINHPLFRMVK